MASGFASIPAMHPALRFRNLTEPRCVLRDCNAFGVLISSIAVAESERVLYQPRIVLIIDLVDI